jgi:hypothetical protein
MNARWALPLFLVMTACSGRAIDVGDLSGGSDAGGETSASSNGSPFSDAARSCDIDNVTGTFVVTYTLQSGTCGDLPSSQYDLVQDWPWNTPGCIVKQKTTSADRCVSTGSADCIVGASTESIQGSITETSPDAIDGTVSIQVTNSVGQCSGTYAIAYRRK